MKLGLLGDIHGNSAALRAVLEAARRLDVEALCVAGDYVGYYYRPEEVLSLLGDWPTFRVRGNHEDMLAAVHTQPRMLEQFTRKYGHGLEYAMRLLSQNERDDLTGLPGALRFDLGGKRILLAHGAPWDVDEYIYPDASEDVRQRLDDGAVDLVILGHTHHRMQLRIGDTLVVNPGSVGQPRDRIPGAAWALLDTESFEVTQFAESYDIASLIAEARAIDPGLAYLQDVLVRT